MAWVAGADVTTGDLITSAQWNNYLGATGSLEYLKTAADKLDDVSGISPGYAKDTIYQNTSGKIKHVNIAIGIDGVTCTLYAEVGATSPPTTAVGRIYWTATDVVILPISFIVPPGYYYRLRTVSGTSGSVYIWYEWHEH